MNLKIIMEFLLHERENALKDLDVGIAKPKFEICWQTPLG